MKKPGRIVGAFIIIAVAVIGGYYFYQQHSARKAGLLSESIEHDGDTWHADFTARLAAPQQQVFDAIRNIEKAQSDEIKSVQVISQSGNQKTVEMQVAG